VIAGRDKHGNCGFFPSQYVEMILHDEESEETNEEEEEELNEVRLLVASASVFFLTLVKEEKEQRKKVMQIVRERRRRDREAVSSVSSPSVRSISRSRPGSRRPVAMYDDDVDYDHGDRIRDRLSHSIY